MGLYTWPAYSVTKNSTAEPEIRYLIGFFLHLLDEGHACWKNFLISHTNQMYKAKHHPKFTKFTA